MPAMLHYDLHCHSTYSDGLLAPAEVVARAAARGVDVLALTDHDETRGLAEARAAADEHGIRLVNGAELSVSWEHHTIHVVALRIDPASPPLTTGLERIRSGRATRARRMADALAECGIRGAYEGALRFVRNEALVSRTHFARYLVEAGYVNDVKDVFNRYLTPGKPGYVAHDWATLPEAIEWIHAAGGQAVLAHPARYDLSNTALRRLLAEFRDLCGDAIEVFSSSHTNAECEQFITLARVFGLLASTGSDFHGAAESTIDLGGLPALPAGTRPVWQHW
ncbi:MAG TPA: 3',5'-nucleoside bisphosphate phosphatase [Burkholderiales bacterium]|nr:3',5'-nucleoside bisphosphate phosphatase [Burkholderiales bacterium]